MRRLTVKQKKLLKNWYEKNRKNIHTGVLFFDVSKCDCFPDDLWEELVMINDTEILASQVNRYISDLGMADTRSNLW